MIAPGWTLLLSIGLLLLALILLIGLTLLRSRIPTALRRIEAYERLTRSVGLAVENGTRLHISLGRGQPVHHPRRLGPGRAGDAP